MLALGINNDLILPDDGHQITNESFSDDFLEAFWKLPQHSNDDNALTLASLYRRMTLPARVAFVALGDRDAEFKNLIRRCHLSYAAFAHPDTNDWPEPAEQEIVDREYLTALEIVMVMRLVDGRRFVELAHPQDGQRYLTFEEFNLFYTTSVADYITQRLVVINKMANAALELCRDAELTAYHVRFINAEAITGKTVIKAYSEKSLHRYLQRMHYTVLELTSTKVATP